MSMKLKLSQNFQNIKGTELEMLFPDKILETATSLQYIIKSSRSISGHGVHTTKSGETEIAYYAFHEFNNIFCDSLTLRELSEFVELEFQYDADKMDDFFNNIEMINYAKDTIPDDPEWEDLKRVESTLDLLLQRKNLPNNQIPRVSDIYNSHISSLFHKALEKKPLNDIEEVIFK